MSDLDSKYKKIETLKLDEDIAGREAKIAALKKELGPDWRSKLKDLGVSLFKAVTNPEALASLRAQGGSGQELRNLNNPSANFGRPRVNN